MVDDERVILTRHSLLETHYQSGWQQNGPYQLINRSLLLAQSAVVMSFYRKCRRGSKASYVLMGHTFRDYGLRADFDGKFGKFHTPPNARTGEILFNESSEYLRQFLGTNYYCIVWLIDATRSIIMSLDVEPLPAKSEETQRLFVGLFGSKLPAADTARLQSCLDEFTRFLATPVATPKLESFDPVIVDSCITLRKDTQPRNIVDLLELTYLRYKNSDLVSNGSPAPNMLFFWRTGDRADLRAGCYPYNVKCIIPPTQRNDLIKALAERAAALRAVQWPVPPVEETVGIDADAAARAEMMALNYLKDPVKLLDRVTRTNQDQVRWFTDYVLSSGIYYARKHIFTRGRLLAISPVQGEDQSTVHELAACFRLLFAVMSDWRGDRPVMDDKALMLVPVHINGAPTACIAGLRRHTDITADPIDLDAFEWTHHFYHSLGKHAIRRLRTRSREFYLDAIAAILRDNLKRALEKKPEPIDFETFCERLESQWRDLGRVYPYPLVRPVVDRNVIHRASDAASEWSAPIDVAVGRILRVYLRANPWFDRNGDETFMEVESVVEHIRIVIGEEAQLYRRRLALENQRKPAAGG